MDTLYNFLDKNKITTPSEAIEFCLKADFQKLLNVATETFAITNTLRNSTISNEPSLFNFSASFALSGANYPCELLDCRLRRLENLAKFSSMYSDNTTIYNPFDFIWFFLNENQNNTISEDHFRFEALAAFAITIEFKNLFESNVMTFSKTIYASCSNCNKKQKKIKNNIYSEFEKIGEKIIYPLLQKEVRIKYEKKSFNLIGIDKLIGEDMFMHYEKIPGFMLKDGRKITSLNNVSYKHPLIQKILYEAIDSLVAQKIGNIQNLSQTYLTNSPMEKILLEKMNKKAESRAFNFFAKGLPIIQGLPYEKIIRVREKYLDSFKAFQANVSETINKAHNFETQEEFDLFVSNKIEKQLDDLKKISTENNKNLALKGVKTGFLLGANIIISSLSNFNYPSLAGLAESFYECTDLVKDIKKSIKKIEENPMYFYFEIKKLNN